MGRTVAIGVQDFAAVRERGNFLVDKTGFVRDWWSSDDDVTLITRPRRFGKTLNLSMVECFFSTKYAGRADLFEGLDVWADPGMRALQGTVPVIFLSLASAKHASFQAMRRSICASVADLYRGHAEELGHAPEDWDGPEPPFGVGPDMTDDEAARSLRMLCSLLERAHGVRPIVLLDEYDTPMQEAWAGGFWDEMAAFMRPLLNATFKTNPHLGRGLMTGITRVSRESIFSDLNNLKVCSVTSEKYATAFGFTEAEVEAAMAEMGRADVEGVRRWYDGFCFGGVPGIYNPWSVTNYLEEGRLEAYWANTSTNALVSRCVARGGRALKEDFRVLLDGGTVTSAVDEQIVFPELDGSPERVWSLLMASGYLKPVSAEYGEDGLVCGLAVTNHETMSMFRRMVSRWFRGRAPEDCDGFRDAMLAGDAGEMEEYLSRIALETFSFFDVTGREPERFYHGFVLGLVVDLRGRYQVLSNRESGFGRFDVALVPCDPSSDPGVVLEFKSCRRGETLEHAAEDALSQVRAKGYAADLAARGVPSDRIRTYGIAFQGKECLVMA